MTRERLSNLARTLRAVKLSPLRAECLMRLQEAGEDGVALRSMASELGITLAGAKQAFRKLEREGYILPLPGRGCGRVKRYEVTQYGVGVIIQIEEV